MNGRLRLAVCGNPVMHSKSPVIFNRVFKETDFSGFYSRIIADSIDEALSASEIISLDGINVTSPFKEAAVKKAEDRSLIAGLLKAANTLTFPGSVLKADNTDPEGVSAPVMKRFPDPGKLKAVVIGAGGAGTAAAYALSECGFKTVMVNRTLEKAEEKISGMENCTAESLDNIDDAVEDASVIVHTLPVAEYYFSPEKIMNSAVLFDANYKYSPLEKTALKRKLEYINGREWLLAQAEAAYRIFLNNRRSTGSINPEPSDNRESGNDLIFSGNSFSADNADSIFSSSPCFDNISLIGFMGSGKSSSGRSLSKLTGYELIDTDSVIEKRAGMSINRIFTEKGESFFRSMERDVVLSALENEKKKIISCGGGVTGDRIIRERLKEKSLPVWLLSSPETSIKRIKNNSRPLLNSSERSERAVSIFNERIDQYGSVSELIINTEIRDAEKTAGRIYEEICEYL